MQSILEAITRSPVCFLDYLWHAAILFRPLFGTLIDDKSRRMVLIIGCIISTVISLSYVLAFSIGILLLVRSLHGIGFSATTNASGTIVSDIVPRSRLAEGVGYFGLSNTLATAVGPALSLLLIQHFNFNVLFLVASIISFIALCCGFFIDYEKKKPEPEDKLSEKKREKKTSLILYLRKQHFLLLLSPFLFLSEWVL